MLSRKCDSMIHGHEQWREDCLERVGGAEWRGAKWEKIGATVIA